MTRSLIVAIAAALLCGALATNAVAADAAKGVTKGDDGKYMTADGTPTYHIAKDGTVDWYTYSGFRRYHSTCHVCHGPDGLGSTFAPALADSLKTMSYEQFADTVVNGRKNVNTRSQNEMPSFGLDPNVMCFLDDIYVYLKARADGALGRGRPHKHEPKSKAAREAEDACMGG